MHYKMIFVLEYIHDSPVNTGCMTYITDIYVYRLRHTKNMYGKYMKCVVWESFYHFLNQ